MNILVGYDGSTAARDALELAKKRAKVWGAKIDVVKCMAQNRLFQLNEYSHGYATGFPVYRGDSLIYHWIFCFL